MNSERLFGSSSGERLKLLRFCKDDKISCLNICAECLAESDRRERKQGALEELELMNNWINYVPCLRTEDDFKEYIKSRKKELEK